MRVPGTQYCYLAILKVRQPHRLEPNALEGHVDLQNNVRKLAAWHDATTSSAISVASRSLPWKAMSTYDSSSMLL